MEIANDVEVYAKSEDHNKILSKLMQVTFKNSFIFNSVKYNVKSEVISFYCIIYNANDVGPVPEKISNMIAMSLPTCGREL